jgi:hypothetical protein
MCDVCARLGQPSRNQALGRNCRSQSLQIDHFKPSFHHFPPHSAHWDENMLSQETLRYLETDSDPHMLTVAQQFQSMIAQPNASMEMNETKPRLGKDEVNILESEFKRNPKPTTLTKRQFAEDMGVDLNRINVRQCEPYMKVISQLITYRIGSKTVEQSASRRRSKRHMRLDKLKSFWGNIQNLHRLILITPIHPSMNQLRQSVCLVDLHL